MNPSDKQTLQRLERAFWVIWAIAPIILIVVIVEIWAMPYAIFDGMELTDVSIKSFSSLGQVLAGIEFVIDASAYIAIVAMMHILVRRFTKEGGLVKPTLQTMKNIATFLLVYAFVQVMTYNINLYVLFKIGDLPEWDPLFYIDMIILAFSLTLFSLRILIREAINLREDADLTI